MRSVPLLLLGMISVNEHLNALEIAAVHFSYMAITCGSSSADDPLWKPLRSVRLICNLIAIALKLAHCGDNALYELRISNH